MQNRDLNFAEFPLATATSLQDAFPFWDVSGGVFLGTNGNQSPLDTLGILYRMHVCMIMDVSPYLLCLALLCQVPRYLPSPNPSLPLSLRLPGSSVRFPQGPRRSMADVHIECSPRRIDIGRAEIPGARLHQNLNCGRPSVLNGYLGTYLPTYLGT